MGKSIQQKKQIATLEIECNMLRHPNVNLHKETQEGASNQQVFMNSSEGELKEENIVHQLIENMEPTLA